MKILMAKIRAGERVTLLDKIEAEESLAELEGMRVALAARQVELTEAQEQAFARRRVELQRGGA